MQPRPPTSPPQTIPNIALLGLQGEGWQLVSVRDEAGEPIVPAESSPAPLLLLEFQRGNVRVLVRCIATFVLGPPPTPPPWRQ